jgi:glycine dehydrogenase subunit 1
MIGWRTVRVIERCAAEGVNPGYPLAGDGLLVAITERRTKAQIDQFAALLQKVHA